MIDSSLLFEFHLIVSFFLLTGVVDADAGLFGKVDTVSFDQGFAPLFADFNIRRSADNRSASLLLNRNAGSGFISSRAYNYGFFSSKIKLPGNYTAGVVVAFYMSNGDVYEKEHDELDIEFLGNVEGEAWRFQTNLYGNGSTKRGREERYSLWFDPTADFHRYSIFWNNKTIIFYVDEVPIREIERTPAMGGDYPSKPMWVYATIWDASSWATSGGQYHVRYEYEPFTAVFSDFVLLEGGSHQLESSAFSTISPAGQAAMRQFREQHMYYSYCYDALRYPVAPPECTPVPSEKALFKESGRLKPVFVPRQPLAQRRERRRTRRRRRAQRTKVIAVAQVVDRPRPRPAPPEARRYADM